MGPVPSNTSVRLMVTLTGSPVFLESKAATGSRYTRVLPPNPPPISIGMTLMLETGIPRMLAHWSLTLKWPWLLDQMVSLPSGLHIAVPAWGSI